MCISACPTGAITENVIFKPGPVKTKEIESICPYCSVGCAISLHTLKGFTFGVSGRKGLVNTDGNICRYAKFGYNYLNDPSRIATPLLKVNGKFEKISFEQAFGLIKEKISAVNPNDNAFFGGARLTNEEMYLIHKLARLAVKTNNAGSFHYLGRGESYRNNCEHTMPFSEIRDASLICYIGTEINRDYAVAGFMAQNAHQLKKIPQLLVTVKENNSLSHKVNMEFKIKSYYHFIKAVNHYILSGGLENALFLRDRTEGFEEYKKQVLALKFDALLNEAGMSADELGAFAGMYNHEMNAVILFSEKEISGAASQELFNLAMITGKLGKTASGLVSLREKNNSQGLFDMGLSPRYGIGGQELGDQAYTSRLKDKWKTSGLASGEAECLHGKLKDGKIKNLFIFGEDPVGCSIDRDYVDSIFKSPEFIVVQDYFITETAAKADLILPASSPAESGGSFTNSQKVIQQFQAEMKPKTGLTNLQQIGGLLSAFGHHSSVNPIDLFMEVVTLFPEKKAEEKLRFHITEKDSCHRNYNYGCDAVTKKFEEEFITNI